MKKGGFVSWFQLFAPIYIAIGLLVSIQMWQAVLKGLDEHVPVDLVPRPVLLTVGIVLFIVHVAIWPYLIIDGIRWLYHKLRYQLGYED
jgi:hypothetical protein